MKHSFLAFTSFVVLASILYLVACGRPQAETLLQPVENSVLLERIEAGNAMVIVDVRSADEYAQGHVPGAINIPHPEIAERSGEIEDLAGGKDQQVLLYCQSGRRAGIAAEGLRKQGFDDMYHLTGDMPGWYRAGYPVER